MLVSWSPEVTEEELHVSLHEKEKKIHAVSNKYHGQNLYMLTIIVACSIKIQAFTPSHVQLLQWK